MSNEMKSFFYDKKFTFQGRVFFPDLLQPKARKPGERLKYSAMFSWPMNSPQNAAMTAQVGAFLAESKQKFFPTIPDQYFVNPIKKWGVYQRTDGKPNHAFLKDSYWINLSSGDQFPPLIVDHNRQPLMDPAKVYSGMNAVVSFSFYALTGEKKGLSANLLAVMIMPGGEKEGGIPQVDVNQVFGSFAADMGIAQPVAAPAGTVTWPPTAPAQPAQPQQYNQPMTPSTFM